MSDLSRSKRRRTSKKPKTRRRSNLIFYFVIALFFATAVLGFKMADAMFEPVVKAKADGGAVIDDNQKNEPKPVKNGAVNILVIGTDERDNEPSRSDTMILATLLPKEKKITLLSIPRDTRVKIPGRGYEKVTHAHAHGGIDLATETVEDFLDIHIDHYVKTNFQGFKNIIDILGGVTLNVEKRMYYPDEEIDLQPGLQNLNGHDALAYVRFRSDGLGDIGRIERQQNFVAVLADHVKSFATIPKIPSIIKELNTYIKTDMSATDIVSYATKFISIDREAIQTFMIPGHADDSLGASYWIADKQELKKILEENKAR